MDSTSASGDPNAPVSGRRPRRLSPAYRFVVGLARPPMTALTLRDWRGAEHLPQQGGFVAAANHISHIDPLTLGHFLLDNGCPPRYLGKQSLFDVPVFGGLIRSAGQIPVQRESADAANVLEHARAAVLAGECVGIYPEATLTRDPDLWPMRGKTGAARVALTTGCPVIPIAQWGAQRLLPPYSKRLNVFGRTTVHVWAGPAVDLSDLVAATASAGPGPAEPGPAVLATATDRIMAAITVLLEQIRGERAPAERHDPRRHDQPRYGNPDRRRSR